MTQYTRRRNVPRAAALGSIVSSIVAVGIISATADTTHAAHSAALAGDGMAGMHMPRQSAATTTGTAVRLHQRVVHVTIHNFAFHPARLVVSPGTRIVWTNTDSDPHTVDSAKGIWSSDALDTGDHFARTFAKAGTFAYYCSIHPFMHGTVIVKK